MIVLGVPENDVVVDNVTAKTDTEKISIILRKIGYGDSNAVSTQRLGRADAGTGRRRPIKIVLPNSEDRHRILALVRNNDNLTGALEGVKLKKDTHPAIRKEYGRMYEAERKEKEKPENVGKEVLFDKNRRVLLVNGEVIDRFKPSFF